MGPTSLETNRLHGDAVPSLMWVNLKISSQKFLKCCQTLGEEISLPLCPALTVSTEVWLCLQCKREPDCWNTVEFHITNTSLQTRLKFSQPLDSVLSRKSSLGLTCLGQGRGYPAGVCGIEGWKNLLVKQHILLFWAVGYLNESVFPGHLALHMI